MEGSSPTAEKPAVTFSLATAFFVLAVLCVLLAEYQALGVQAVGAWWFTLLFAAAYLLHRTRFVAARNLACGVFLLTGLWAMLPGLVYPGWVAQQVDCSNKLKQLAIAAHDYEYRNTTFPSGTYNIGGVNEGLSWRVSLLPFLEQGVTYKKFNLQQGWQSATNQPLAKLPMREYRCAAEMNVRNNETSYVAITGDDTCWPESGAISLAGVKDGQSNTILFTETHDSGILWPEPRDLEYDKLDWRIHGTPGNSISSSHGPVVQYFDGSRKLKKRMGVNAAMADGSVRRFTPDIDPEVLKQMVNRRDGLPDPPYDP